MATESFGEAVALFERYRAEYLAAARAFMKEYASDGRVVTVNDLINHGPAVPDGLDPRVRGAVFNDKQVWERIGYTSSPRRISHCRPVQQFRLASK
jgi:hypothetical protein